MKMTICIPPTSEKMSIYPIDELAFLRVGWLCGRMKVRPFQTRISYFFPARGLLAQGVWTLELSLDYGGPLWIVY